MRKRETTPPIDKDAERYNTAAVKLMAMLLVVLCHSASIYMPGGWGPYPPARGSVPLGLLASWLNTFHIHTFVAVSGYLFYYLRCETHRYDDAAAVIRKKAARLLLPYACASALWVMPFDAAFWGVSPARLFREYALMTNPSQLWFLPMLFFVFVAFILLARRVDFRAQKRGTVFIWIAALYLVNLLASAVGGGDWSNVFQLRRAAQFLLYFYLGMQLRRLDTRAWYRVGYVLLALAASVGLFALGQVLSGLSGPLRYLRLLLAPLGSVSGVLFIWLLVNRTAPAAGTENRFFRFMRGGAFPVYLFHQQFIYLVIMGMNRASVAPYLLEEAAFAVSLAASLGMYWVLRRWRVTRRMFGIGESA